MEVSSQIGEAEAAKAAERLLLDALAAEKDDLDEQSVAWEQLRGRAKGSFTLAVLTFAGIGAWWRYGVEEPSRLEGHLLLASFALIAVSAVVALVARFLRRGSVEHDDLEEGGAPALLELDARLADHRERLRALERTGACLASATRRRSRVLLVAQMLLSLAIVCASAAALLHALG